MRACRRPIKLRRADGEQEMEDAETLVTLTADIVAAHVSNNSVAISDIPLVIRSGA